MNAKTAIMLLAACACCAPPAAGQDAPADNPLQHLEVRIAPLRGEWLPGQPVYLYLHFQNRARWQPDAPELLNQLRFRSNLNLNSDVQLAVQYEDYPPKPYQLTAATERRFFPEMDVTIPHGRTWTLILPLCYDWKYISGYALGRAGKYRIGGQILLQQGRDFFTAHFQPFELTIVPPEGRDAELRRALDYPEFAKAFSMETFEDPGDAQRAQELLERFPNSAYAANLSFLLAKWHLQQDRRGPALDLLKRANPQVIPAELTLHTRALCLAPQGPFRELCDTLWQLWDLNEDIFLISAKNHLYQRYFRMQKNDERATPWNLID